MIQYFKENKVENILLIGGINRPDFFTLRVDLTGGALIAKILKQKILGDDNLLRIVSDYIESKGFKIISPAEILSLGAGTNAEIGTGAGAGFETRAGQITSKKVPSEQDMADIEIGKNIAKSLGALDVGQSVIVADGYVLGVEAAEGTDNLIQRCAELREKPTGGVLVKMSKSAQDMRLDVPAIGVETIRLLAECGFNGVAIEQNGVIVISPESTKQMLDKAGVFFSYI